MRVNHPGDLDRGWCSGNTASLLAALLVTSVSVAAPPPPSSVTARDVPWDAGGSIELSWTVASAPGADSTWVIERLQAATPTSREEWIVVAGIPSSERTHVVSKLPIEEPHSFRIRARDAQGVGEPSGATEPTTAARNLFIGAKFPLFAGILVVSTCVIACILAARAGRPLRIRRIAALDAVDDAVGRATEMGRPMLFVPGIQDMDNIQTVAGITVLGHVAKTAAEYDATVEVPTSRSLVMEAAREAVQASYLSAGRSDSYNPDLIRYITDEQFGFVAYVSGRMVREKPAACFYMGCFFAESLILAETGNAIGAIQIAGTAESSQLPFFVAACDYTLIGEEFFAASAYLSHEPDQMGSLKGQDFAKLIAGAIISIGAALATAAAIWPGGSVGHALAWFKEMLGS